MRLSKHLWLVGILCGVPLGTGEMSWAQESSRPENSAKPATGRSVQWNSNVLVRELALAVGHPLVQQELELLPYQIEQLKQLQYDLQAEVTKVAREYARTRPADRDRGLAELYDRTRGEIERALLPKQIARLEQIAVQSLGPMADSEDGMALVTLLSQPMIRSELEISADEITSLQALSQEQSEKLKREIAELRARANQIVLSGLNEETRRKIQQLVGEPFDFGDYQLQAGGVIRRSKDSK
jgi:hypothetical protein